MADMRTESDSLGVVEVPADKLWGAQTQRSLDHFSIGADLMPREMIGAYATLKKAASAAEAIMSPAADARGPVEYRKHVGGIMVTRALTRAAARAS